MSESIIFEYQQLPEIAKAIFSKIKSCEVVTFTGPLGAGKTTLIREILGQFGVNEDVVSPTFTYLNVYKNAQGKKFFHFDLYRIKSVDEFLMAGFDEYLETPNSVCFIEWPEVIEPLLQNKKTCHITIDYEKNNKRIIKF